MSLFAHQAQGGGFLSGLAHPILGADHLLAMIMVGILSVQIGGKAIWKVPVTFVSVMLIGGLVAFADISFPEVELKFILSLIATSTAIELGIVLSVIVLGTAIALDKKIPVIWAMFFVGFFALFHGYAHGSEMPRTASPILFTLGFVIATACLHIFGLLIGLLSTKVRNGAQILRFLGAAMAVWGVTVLFGL